MQINSREQGRSLDRGERKASGGLCPAKCGIVGLRPLFKESLALMRGQTIANVNPRCAHSTSPEGCAHCTVRLVSVCAALSTAELVEIEAMSQSTTVPAKGTLAVEHEPADYVFTITEGMARLVRLLPDGRRQIVGFALPGDFLGLALLDSYDFTAEAIINTRVCRFPRREFVAYVDRKPHLLRRLHEFAAHELSLAQDQMVLLGRRTAEERLAAFFLTLHDRWRRLGHVSVTLQLPMGRQDIADYLGLTIETVSRTFTKLVKAKTIVIVPDGVRLLRPDHLQELTAA